MISGTALYAYVLDQLGYFISIVETRFHLFLPVELKDLTKLMIETTDPFHGFIVEDENIEKQINHYLSNEKVVLEQESTIAPPFNNQSLFQTISFKDLSGLHYYNKAIHLVNKGEFAQAQPVLIKANLLYPSSERIQHFMWLASNLYDHQLATAFTNR